MVGKYREENEQIKDLIIDRKSENLLEENRGKIDTQQSQRFGHFLWKLQIHQPHCQIFCSVEEEVSLSGVEFVIELLDEPADFERVLVQKLLEGFRLRGLHRLGFVEMGVGFAFFERKCGSVDFWDLDFGGRS